MYKLKGQCFFFLQKFSEFLFQAFEKLQTMSLKWNHKFLTSLAITISKFKIQKIRRTWLKKQKITNSRDCTNSDCVLVILNARKITQNFLQVAKEQALNIVLGLGGASGSNPSPLTAPDTISKNIKS